jgi:hypothetical protein
MIDRRIKWPLFLAIASALTAIGVMVLLLRAELPLEAASDPAEIAARTLAKLADVPAAERSLAGVLVKSDSGAVWVIVIIVALFGFIGSAKTTTERIALQRVRRRRRDRLTREIEERLAAEAKRS